MNNYKQWKKIIVFASVLVILIGVLIVNSVLTKEPATSEDPTPTPGPDPVTDIDAEDAESVTIENAKGVLVFRSYFETVSDVSSEHSSGVTPFSSQSSSSEVKKELVWKLDSPQGIPYSSSTVKSRASDFLSVSVSSEVTNDVSKLSDYGLDDPKSRVEIKLRSGNEVVILFGNEVVGGNEYYVMIEGSSRICTVTAYKAEYAMIGFLDLIDKNIFGELTAENTDEVEFRRSRDMLDLKAHSVTDPESEPDQQVKTWEVDFPIKAEASADGFYAFVSEIFSVSPVEYKELHPEDLSVYGLDSPLYDFVLTGGSGSISLVLGGDAGAGMIYGYSDSIDAVFTVSLSGLSYIDKPATELISSFIYLISIWEVTDIDIVIGQDVINCEIEDDQNKDITSDFRVNGKDANVEDSSGSSYFRTFYQSVISIFIEGLDLDAEPENSQDITLTYTLKEDNSKVRYDFSKRDEFSYYCFRDGEYQGYYVSSDDFFSETAGNEGILPAYRILMNAVENQVNGVYQ